MVCCLLDSQLICGAKSSGPQTSLSNAEQVTPDSKVQTGSSDAEAKAETQESVVEQPPVTVGKCTGPSSTNHAKYAQPNLRLA